MSMEYVYGITVTWQNWSTGKETSSSDILYTTNPTCIGSLGM